MWRQETEDWTGLDWTGLDWTGLDWTGLDWTGRRQKRIGLEESPWEIDCLLDYFSSGWNAAEGTGQSFNHWIQQDSRVVTSPDQDVDRHKYCRPAEGGKKAPAPLPITSEGGKGEKAPEVAGPSAPPESARGEKAAEWTVVVRRKKAVARSTGAAKQGVTKPAAAPSGGGSGGVPEKGTPSMAPPARQGGKAARKTKHLIPTEGEEKSAAGGELPVAVAGQGTASGSVRGKRKAQAKDGPPKPKRPPRRPPSAGNEGPGPRNATEGEKDPSPEAVRGSAEEAAEPMEEAPAERPKGREEPARAERALRVDPPPVTKETSEASPDSTTEGPAAGEVAEGAQEGPPKEQLPRAPPSSDGDTGLEPCVAEEGVTAEPAPEAEAGSADNVEPMQATSAEEPEGEKELPLPEHEPPRAPEASVGSADNAKPMQTTPAEGPEGGKEPPQEQEPPRAPEASKPAEGGKKVPAPLPVTSREGKGEKAPEAAGPCAPPENARGEKAAVWPVVARRKKAVARSTGVAEQGVTKPAAAPSGGGSGGVPEKGTPSTAPPARQCGKATRKTKHLIPGYEERSAAGGVLPVAETGQGTASGSIRGKRKAQARLPTCARKCTRTGLTVGVPGGAKEGPQKRKRLPRRPPSTGTATEGEMDPSPEAVRGSAETAEPMEEAPAERPKGSEEPARAEEALRKDPLPVTLKTSEAGPDFTIKGPTAEEVAEGAQEGPPKEQLPRAPPSSDGDTGPETCVAEEGAAEAAPEAEAGSAGNAELMQATPAEGPEGGEEPPLPEKELPLAPVSGEKTDSAPKAGVGSADSAEPMQATLAEGSEGGEEPPQEQDLPQASLSCGDGGFGPRAAAEGDEETPPEAEAGSAEPALTLVSGAWKGGEETKRAKGGALEVDPLPEVQRGQIPVTEGAREEPLKEQPPRASLSGGGEGSGPCAHRGAGSSHQGGAGGAPERTTAGD
ncbi:UNVERIFIED_CONTAM: hypothetical protein FKN15_032843 [Acipenser sinensis]